MLEPVIPEPVIPEPVIPEPTKKITKKIDDQPFDELKRELEQALKISKEKDQKITGLEDLTKVQEAALKALDIQKNTKTELSLLDIVHRIMHPYMYDNPFDYMAGKKKE